MTKRLFILTLAIGLTLSFSGIAFASDFAGTGEIVELGCYKSQNATGEGHAACAKKCLSGGKAMGLLLEDGSIVELAKGDETVYESAIELAGKQAKVTGSKADGKVTIASVAAAS